MFGNAQLILVKTDFSGYSTVTCDGQIGCHVEMTAELVVSAVKCSSHSSTDQRATDGTAVHQRIRCDSVGGDECDRIWMRNINYDECRPCVICSVSAVTRVGGSRSHGDNKTSLIDTYEETELVPVPGMKRYVHLLIEISQLLKVFAQTCSVRLERNSILCYIITHPLITWWLASLKSSKPDPENPKKYAATCVGDERKYWIVFKVFHSSFCLADIK